MGNCSSVTAPPINETEILPYLEAHLERGSKPPRHAANGVSEVPPQPLQEWHVKERGASRLPFGHKHFLAGIFKPQEADDPDPHPHGEWRWLTGMPDGALRLKMAEELGSRQLR